MAGRKLPSLLALFLVSALPAVAAAEDAAPDGGEPKVLGGGADDSGNHLFLFGRPGAGPTVFAGQAGKMRQIDVLGIERFPNLFVVDTLELGTIKFDTTPGRRGVSIPGDIGFARPDDPSFRPTRTFNRMPDANVFVEVMTMMRPASAQPAAPRQIEGRALPRGTQDGRVRSMKKSAAARFKKKQINRRPPARTRVARKQGRVRTH
jgi:hypothetical protein